jgi:hydroxymethylbilane synthase
MRIGTRGSRLALWQAQAVANALAAGGHGPCEIVTLKTSGDRLQEKPLSEQGGKRLFVKEIEDALLSGDVDAAVHSAKDMPADLPRGLVIGGVLEREDPRDALVLPHRRDLGLGTKDATATSRQDLQSASETESLVSSPQSLRGRIGTGSIRRIAQLRAAWTEARFEPTRGNVDTRLRKLDDGQFDALVLAAAGLKRLGFGDRISSLIPLSQCVPAPGQGTIAIEIRADDRRARAAVASLNHEATAIALEAERAVVDGIGGGCQLPLGAVAIVADGAVDLQTVVIAPDGSRIARARLQGAASHPRDLGRRAADELAAAGAREILDGLGIRR